MEQKKTICDRIKKYADSTVEQLLDDFKISDNGYSQDEVVRSRQKYGNNSVISKNQDTIIHCIRRAFINPFSIILFCFGMITFVTDVLLSSTFNKNLTTVCIIFSMLIVSGIVRMIQELRSKKTADGLTELVHATVMILRDGAWLELSPSQAVVGDRIFLKAGDRVPADMRIIKASDLFVSQSVITGESAVIEKNADSLIQKTDGLNEYSNILFGGTTITGGSATGIVLAVGDETVYGGLNVSGSERKHGFDKGANSIAWVLIKFMVILVPVVFIASGITKGNWLQAFLFALSVAVGLTPELLPMVVNACLAKGSYSMGQKQTIVKNINAMQGFGSMDVLCVDKTGTLTGDTIMLEYYMDVLGNESLKTLDYAYLASYFHTGVGNHLDEAILRAKEMPARKEYYNDLVRHYPKIDEQPFDYNRRFSSVLLKGEKENLTIIKGSIESVVKRCGYIEYGDDVRKITGDAFYSVHSVVDEMMEDGMKVIAVAYKKTENTNPKFDDGHDFILIGYLAFFDAPKKSAASAVTKLKELNINVKVLTGDQKPVAESVCRRLKIRTERYITGAELDSISEDELAIAVENNNVFAELSPKQKELIVKNLQENGHTVGFMGDGINDLPAMLEADVGISVENAAETVKESADVILLKKDLNILEEGVLEGRKAFANMSKYIRITASSNFGNICAIVIASVLLPFFPMTSVQILLLNLLYDMLCLVLPWDNVDKDMLTKPLEWSGSTMGRFMAFFGLISSVFDIITFAFLFFVLGPAMCGGDFYQLDLEGQKMFISVFQTGWFLESMWTQVLILQLLRTKQIPFVSSRPGRPVIYISVLGIVLFSLLPITPLGTVLGLTVMPVVYYIFLVAIVFFYMLLVTAAKAFYVKRNERLV